MTQIIPYTTAKMWPKDEETRSVLAENISRAVQESIGCPPQAVTVSIDEIEKYKWAETVGPDSEARKDRMFIAGGEKQF